MKKVSDAIAAVHGRRFIYGPASIVICKFIRIIRRLQKKLDRFRVCFAVSLTMSVFADPTTGDATDWTYAMLGIIHSYSIELRPTSQDERGFIVPPQQIVDSGSEILNGMVELVGNLSD